jgi:predicted GNAT family acetyltransferase
MHAEASPDLTDNRAMSRFEAHISGELAGFADYERAEAVLSFTHTVVLSAFEGQGIGSALARFGLDAVRSEGLHRVNPVCPFIHRWIERHPDYADLLA